MELTKFINLINGLKDDSDNTVVIGYSGDNITNLITIKDVFFSEYNEEEITISGEGIELSVSIDSDSIEVVESEEYYNNMVYRFKVKDNGDIITFEFI